MQKLTLSVDRHVVARAKRFARAQGTSVSRLVEGMLDLASRPGGGSAITARELPTPPVLARLRGALKRGSVAEYQRLIERKYR